MNPVEQANLARMRVYFRRRSRRHVARVLMLSAPDLVSVDFIAADFVLSSLEVIS